MDFKSSQEYLQKNIQFGLNVILCKHLLEFGVSQTGFLIYEWYWPIWLIEKFLHQWDPHSIKLLKRNLPSKLWMNEDKYVGNRGSKWISHLELYPREPGGDFCRPLHTFWCNCYHWCSRIFSTIWYSDDYPHPQSLRHLLLSHGAAHLSIIESGTKVVEKPAHICPPRLHDAVIPWGIMRRMQLSSQESLE